MPKAVKTSGVNASAIQGMPFETAVKKLESIVESMEADDLPLETLLDRFEEGSKLAEHCQTKLSEAELKIQKLEKNPDGELVLEEINVSGESSDDSASGSPE
ncbi:MAG: exodeoxyribonuclease VII small subunit [Verrucomicrobia bacterium]|nr:exodeoxyribonuclease VII small subunit [Verrucomicrobiota bacterium]